MQLKLLNQKIGKIFSMPPHRVIKKITKKINTKVSDKINEISDIKKGNYKENKSLILYSYIKSSQLNLSLVDKVLSQFLCDKYLDHCFNLLGSGFIKVNYNISPLGIEEIKYNMSPKINTFDSEGEWLSTILLPSHISKAKDFWKKVDTDYIPIDWQIDFKSGFRYSQKVWYKKQPIGKPKGADIKVPWEISRMQHLPQLSIFSLILPDRRDKIIKEFKNEIYDFASTNPVRLGVNWTCPMDVGIRAANILIAYDILKDTDKNNILGKDFESFLGSFIYQHGEFIINNLEWNDGENNNHYLSDICGLLYVSAYLERNEVVDSWLAFSIQEIIECMEKQFYKDGGNFEGSTSYHRLSSELMIYSSALVFGLLKTDKKIALKEYNHRNLKRLIPANMQKFNLSDGKFFPQWYLDRLFRTGLLTMDITKENGKVTQIGDNDSGRFLKFTPIGKLINIENAINKYQNLDGYDRKQKDTKYYDEDILDHVSLISALSGLFDSTKFEEFSKECPLEKSIIRTLTRDIRLRGESYPNSIELIYDKLSLSYKNKIVINFKDYCNHQVNLENLRFIGYPYFGLYIFRDKNFYLSIYAGSNGQNGNGCHSHNDKLSFELNLCGRDIFADPGTFLYTPIPEIRDKFRSVELHNVIIVDNMEQNEFIGLSGMSNDTKCSIIDHGSCFLKFKLEYRNVVITRKFIINEDSLAIEDECNKEFISNFNNTTFASGYGQLVRF